jgi:DNA helicase-2/ATP-dependent DNA helicase PcrA
MDKDRVLSKILNEPRQLSETQKQAVTSNSKYLRVIAGAGAGKTETLTRRIAYLLLYKEVNPSSIVAFTFTEKAAQSMKSRLYRRISELGREDIVKKLGEMYIGTIHSFCLQILEDYFGYGNYNVFDENQEMAFLLRHGWELGLNRGSPYSQNCENFLDSLKVVYSEMLDRKELEVKAPDFHKKLIRYEALLDSHRRLTFDRMIYETVERLKEHLEKVGHIDYLIVDEFQDINKAQFLLIELIGKDASVFVVGDPRQSIYQWRGSNERFFLDFATCFPGAETINIRKNWRSVKEIVRVSNKFADWFEEAEYEHMEPQRKSEGEIVKLRFRSDEDEAEWVADQIERLVAENNCNYSDFGVLMRSVNTSADPFIRAFRQRRIPYLVGGKVGLFKREETQAVGRLISWISDEGFWIENPYSWRDQTRGDDLLETGLEAWEVAVDFPLPTNIREQLKEWKNDVLNKKYPGFKELYHALLLILGYHNLDPDNRLHAALMANLGRFSSLLGDFEVSRRLGGGRVNWKSDIKNLCWFMNTYASKSYDEQPGEDLRGVDAVQITTVHQAKGLEWPVIFLPALVVGRFPSSRAGTQRPWLIPRDMFNARRYEGGEEEEKRLFYVAITRARDTAILSYFKKYKRTNSQSHFLDILDEVGVNEFDGYSYSLNYESEEKIPEDEIQTFSTTEIIDYMKCPQHYRFLKIWGYIQSHSPLIGYGEALHFCLRRAAELIKNEGLSPRSAVATAVEEGFFLPFASPDLRDRLKDNAKKRLKQFARDHEQDMYNIDEVEVRLEFPVQNATIVGKVDVILKEDGSFEVWDYKTSDQVITHEDSALQVRLYAMGLKNMGRNIERGSVASLDDARLIPVSVEDNDLENSKKTAEEIISKIKEGDFTAKPSDFCGQCEYSNICRWGD